MPLADQTEPGNQLAHAGSAYLRQHANQPVHWYQWGDDAFLAAQKKELPIFISIGYAACHWCHVMAHESFDDPAIAAILNAHFVPIKVDRETHPHVDAFYQRALMLMGGQGGWPLSIFADSQGKPFWGGTYFPPTPGRGLPGFPGLLQRIFELWQDPASGITANLHALARALDQQFQPHTSKDPLTGGHYDDESALIRELAQHFDPVHGGMSGQPKFPQAPLWRTVAMLAPGEPEAANMLVKTMLRISKSGMADQIGGGFARYSVDQKWLVPHFEKMLYDNGQILGLLAQAAWHLPHPLFTRAAEGIVQFLEEWLEHSSGLFYSSLDADSEGVEGKFYVWKPEQITARLKGDASRLMEVLGITRAGNWEGHSIANLLHYNDDDMTSPIDQDVERLIEKLRIIRDDRPRPALDDKILCDWNALLVHGLTQAAIRFNRKEWLARAESLLTALDQKLRDKKGHLHHAAFVSPGSDALQPEGLRPEGLRLEGRHLLDDYAAMIDASLALGSATGTQAWFDKARHWCDEANLAFYDEVNHGWYACDRDDAKLLPNRPVLNEDHATPSGNGLMALNCARLWWLTGDQQFEMRARATIERFQPIIQQYKLAVPLMIASQAWLNGGVVVVIAGHTKAKTRPMHEAVLANAPCEAVIMLNVANSNASQQKLSKLYLDKGMIENQTTAWICTGTSCRPPVTNPANLTKAMFR